MLTLVLALLLFMFLPWRVALPLYVAIAVGWLAITRKALAAQHEPPISGPEAMVGDRAVVTSVGDKRAQARYRGESWRAESSLPLRAGEPVLIESVDGLTLRVAPHGAHEASRSAHDTLDAADLAGSDSTPPSSALCNGDSQERRHDAP